MPRLPDGGRRERIVGLDRPHPSPGALPQKTVRHHTASTPPVSSMQGYSPWSLLNRPTVSALAGVAQRDYTGAGVQYECLRKKRNPTVPAEHPFDETSNRCFRYNRRKDRLTKTIALVVRFAKRPSRIAEIHLTEAIVIPDGSGGPLK